MFVVSSFLQESSSSLLSSLIMSRRDEDFAALSSFATCVSVLTDKGALEGGIVAQGYETFLFWGEGKGGGGLLWRLLSS